MGEKKETKVIENQLEPLSKLFAPGTMFRKVLPELLIDHTTEKNIVWATDTYQEYGSYYSAERQMFPDFNLNLIEKDILCPRVLKSKEKQKERTKKKAEVFTPSWVCCMMINFCDDVYFGRENVFTVIDRENRTWKTVEEKIEFPPQKGNQGKRKRWMSYVIDRRIEITCGEAPFLVSRYDTTTGELIPIKDRIGIIDRKLRVVDENAKTDSQWKTWVEKAFKASYGYEYQGDNLFFARVNLLQTYIDYYKERFEKEPSFAEVENITKIISWNVWQMDGLKDTVPYGIPEDIYQQESLFKDDTGPVYAKTKDWDDGDEFEFRKVKEIGKE